MNNIQQKPLADRMRPRDLNNFFGQNKIVGKNSLLEKSIKVDRLPSMIFWGPPGCGKTTLAYIISQKTKADFIQISAVSSGLKDLREILEKIKTSKNKNILFIDEIHRWNKIQQDALLPYVENGTIVLIGATTENPSFEVRSALLSRMHVFVLSGLSEEHIEKILKRAIKDEKRGLGKKKIKISEKTIKFLANVSNGDARTSLNILDYASSISKKIEREDILQALQKPNLIYDKDGAEHYNLISALHKSMRGSNENASLYWLARMLEAGEDPIYIARRIVRFASEDIGLANSKALEQALAAFKAVQVIGMPEANVILAQAVVYMAKCKKSNSLYVAYRQAAQDANQHGNLPVPLHLRNAPTKLMKNLNYGKNYKYSPDYNYKETQNYFPDELKGRRYL